MFDIGDAPFTPGIDDFDRDCLKWHGRILTGDHAHYCFEWDGLPIDETCEEFDSSTCMHFIDGMQVVSYL